jgi:hypothetical protein
MSCAKETGLSAIYNLLPSIINEIKENRRFYPDSIPSQLSSNQNDYANIDTLSPLFLLFSSPQNTLV